MARSMALAGAEYFQGNNYSAASDFRPLTTPPPLMQPHLRSDGLLQGLLTLRSGRERGAIPILFLTRKEGGITHYQYDFDRDGAPELVAGE